MNLTKNFTVAEFEKSRIATKNKIDNKMGIEEIRNATILCCLVLEPIRALYNLPVTITSGFRCEIVNTLAKGSKDSDHKKALAVDFKIEGVDLMTVFRMLKESVLFKDCFVKPYAGWIHISYRGGLLCKI